ncbi:ECF RNA polymerase sigma factor SigD [Sporotomaculum syntrophicum]|uniref:ECF RNA polymerase sigma factor SigD n=1 Tax=Sporotomaculum syntrophicum TaxID=182264 RepID=A0A9D3AXS9_9FIRM|nr:RNA polymerase sigma factor [Sporotomaculum syntrophicum]KAF1085332.1 ECF RNA polymerase sigma factor SigD [Sporotomaculum syntrophicum]
MTVNYLKKAQEGDIKSIEQICMATWEPLYRFIYFKVQNREEAEDITQETYVKTLTYLQEHNISVQDFPCFMKTVALNVLRDRWRQKKRRGVPVNFDEINPQETVNLEQDQQIAITQRMQIENALARLNAKQRTVLDLRIIKGYSVAETAKLVGKTEAAVRTAQYRALQALAKVLDSND